MKASNFRSSRIALVERVASIPLDVRISALGRALGRVGRLGLPAILLAYAIGATEPARAQSTVLLDRPNVSVMEEGVVYASVRLPDGSVVVGGSLSSANAVPRSALFKRAPDGSLDLDWNPGVAGVVYALATDAAGNLYVGGSFSSVAGLPRGNLVKLSGDGAVDTEWNPSTNGPVSALAIGVTGDVYVGGNFSTAGGQPRASLAKLSGSGAGIVDADWKPAPDGSISAIAVDANGNVFVGGDFDQIDGVSRGSIAKLSGSGAGSVDPIWVQKACLVTSMAIDTAGNLFVGGNAFGAAGCITKLSTSGDGDANPSWASFTNEHVLAVATDAAGNVYAGGVFTKVGDVPRSLLVKLSSSGVVDPDWNPSAEGRASLVESLATDVDGNVYVGGAFNRIAGAERLSFAALSPAGAVGAATDAERPGIVEILVRQPDGSVIVGGDFQKADVYPRRYVFRLRADGTVDPEWNPSPDSFVYGLAVDAAGAVYAGGIFSSIGGQPRHKIAKLSGSGTGAADPDWRPSVEGRISDNVETLAVSAAGDLYVSGRFDTVNGFPRPRLVKLSTQGAGEVDPVWNPSPDGSVSAMAWDAGGNFYVAGGFSQIGGVARRGLAKLADTGSGVIDPVWNPAANSAVEVLEIDAAGDIFVAGYFTTIGGLPRQRLAKLSSGGAGAVDPDWNPSADERVSALAVTTTGQVYISGDFTTVGGQPHKKIAKLSGSGSGAPDATWNPEFSRGAGPYADVRDLEADADGNVWVAGWFSTVDGQPRKGIAAFGPAPDFLFVDGFESAPERLAEAEG